MPCPRRRQGKSPGSASIGPGALQTMICAEVHGTLVHEDRFPRRLDAHEAVHLLVGELRLLAGNHDPHAPDAQTGGRAEVHPGAAIERTGAGELAIREALDGEAAVEGRVAGDTRLAADPDLQRAALAHRVRRAGGLGVCDEAEGSPLRTRRTKRAKHSRRIGIAAGARVVLGVGNHHRAVRAAGDGHRATHPFLGKAGVDLEGRLPGRDVLREALDGRFGRFTIRAVGEDDGAAFGKVRGRKARREGDGPDALALVARQLSVDARHGFEHRALRTERDEKRQAPHRHV